MSYDLIFRREINKDYSRDNILKAPQTIAAGLLGIAVLAKVVIIPKIIRARENRMARVQYAVGHEETMRIPNVPMRQLVAIPLNRRR